MEDLLPMELYDFLLQNGLPEDVSREFVNNEITGEGLLLLSEMEIKELAPKIGDRIKLRKLINKKVLQPTHRSELSEIKILYRETP